MYYRNINSKDICKLYESGKSISTIAKEFNVSIGTIRNRLIDNNINLRGKGNRENLVNWMDSNPNFCMGSNSSQWKGGCRDRARVIAQSVLLESGIDITICQYCGSKSSTLNYPIHHLDGNYNNNTIKNLQVLCSACHGTIHHGTFSV